ncbi:hypothetical protein MKS83_10115 [Chryseobacterium sp. Y16C]|uniref:hypothetical protein n=1 Tax=Chryseobacterium sp. Y16C TaxID=2920939 RepID=UPI001F0BCEA8|nr:hypothetical protein [Chryseobacterium sp. Y16C]UMQ44040.1 hypothetical protein MKS83_10115 [Chryseobacterium sp. Y16C]
MKNILLKSIQIFAFMSMMNLLLSVLISNIAHFPGGSFGMYPFLLLIECLVASAIAFITVCIFRKSYRSVLRIAVLFQIIYLISLILIGFNPFGSDAVNILSLLLYINSFIVLLVVYLLYLLYSKIILGKSKN